MPKLYLTLLMLAVSLSASAQISGAVTDAEGYPLTGVTVQIVGTSIGAVTDLKGNYSVNGTGDALRFSYTGYETQVVMIDGRSVVDMILF
ncbi:MAG: carboxypeptidase-like regulatory domain-containing protein, partial [Bacteroidota bacterium]